MVEVIVFWANQNFSIQRHTEKQTNKQTNKKLNVVLLNWKISKNRVCKHDKKLFVRNYFSKCSEVLLKINFVISDMEVYLVKLSPLNIYEATALPDLEKPERH